MTFTSLNFLVFITIFTAVFLGLAQTRFFKPFLLVASYVFYGWWDYRFCGLLALTTVVDYYCALRVADAPTRREAKVFLFASLGINLGILFFFKYFNFFIDSAETALLAAGIDVGRTTLEVILPVGISFFTFQNLSYTIDVYTGHLKAERKLLNYATFVAFFPQLVAGPVVRARDLLPQIVNKPADVDFRFRLRGLEKVVWGFFLKLGLADNAAAVVDARFANPEFYNAFGHVLGLVCFSLQIYGDFAGYSLIAIGIAQIYGYTLNENFRRPYFSTGFGDFWKRWHISLSSWFRDYLYVPMGGNKTQLLRVRNVAVVMLVSGLWHGAAWTFVLWGALHAALMLAEDLVRRFCRTIGLQPTGVWKLPARLFVVLLVFALVTLTWLPFRADSMQTVNTILSIIAAGDFSIPHGMQQMSALFRVVVIAGVVFAIDLMGESGFGVRYARAGVLTRSFAMSSAVLLILLLGSFQSRSFIYFQF